jgi:hypothetical protein
MTTRATGGAGLVGLDVADFAAWLDRMLAPWPASRPEG